MKKLTALLLALLMLTFAFVACRGDDENTSPEGKTFAYEKNEIEFENEKIEAAFTALLAEGQTAGDYICETFLTMISEDPSLLSRTAKCIAQTIPATAKK